MNEELSLKLGYHFNEPKLLQLALTHRSSENENNERLEFLGDSIVNLIIADALYQQFPHASEGTLSRFRASLINRDTLGELARSLDVGRYLRLGLGELKSGGGERLSILSCAMEAIIGAIFCDGGFEAARKCVLDWYQPLLNNLTSESSQKDPKTLLQEYLQSKRLPLPQYTVKSIIGDAHRQVFIVHCTIKGVKQKTEGRGLSRRRAEQQAANFMLEYLKS